MVCYRSFFEKIIIKLPADKNFTIHVTNYNPDHFYIKSAELNGKTLDRNWLTHQEIMDTGELQIETSAVPYKDWGVNDLLLINAVESNVLLDE